MGLVGAVMTASIRRATIADAEVLSNLMTQLGYPTKPGAMIERLEVLLPREQGAAFVSEDEGAVVVMIGVELTPSYEHDGLIGRITALVVDERRRGQGIGQALLEVGESWLRDRGAERVTLTSATRRADAHRFYARLGDTQTGIRLGRSLR